jgi:GNAT superfamily N-acetyltransferase
VAKRHGVDFGWRVPVDDADVECLHADAFGGTPSDYRWRQLRPFSLGWVTASADARLIGFVNVVWDGNCHAFLLDVAVATDRQRQGIGRLLVEEAIEEIRRAGCEWVHVDFEERLAGFYSACGFTPTAAGLRRVN